VSPGEPARASHCICPLPPEGAAAFPAEHGAYAFQTLASPYARSLVTELPISMPGLAPALRRRA